VEGENISVSTKTRPKEFRILGINKEEKQRPRKKPSPSEKKGGEPQYTAWEEKTRKKAATSRYVITSSKGGKVVKKGKQQ